MADSIQTPRILDDECAELSDDSSSSIISDIIDLYIDRSDSESEADEGDSPSNKNTLSWKSLKNYLAHLVELEYRQLMLKADDEDARSVANKNQSLTELQI